MNSACNQCGRAQDEFERIEADRDRYKSALVEAHRQLSRFDFKGPKQLGRAMADHRARASCFGREALNA